MNLDDLRYFTHAAVSGSFAKGAALAHVSRPAISKAIARLEGELGVELFARTTRRVALTASGAALLESSRRIFTELDDLRGELDGASSLVRGDVKIGAMEVFSIDVLPRAITALVLDHPEVRPRSYEMLPQRMEELLLEHRLDVAFTIGGGAVPGLRYHSLGRSRAVIVCGRSHPLYAVGRVSPGRLREHPFVVPEFLGMEHIASLDEFPAAQRRTVGATIELLQMGVRLAMLGRYLGYFPEVSVRTQLERGELRALKGLGGPASFDLRAITRDARVSKPATRELIEHVRAEIRRVPAPPSSTSRR
jgi:DNA-binding transcriptional LysR family regulator